MKRRWAAVGCLVVVALSGCGGGGEEASSTTTTTAVTTTTATTTSIRQVASVVAKHRALLLASLDLIQNCFDRHGAVCFEGENLEQQHLNAVKIAADFRRALRAVQPVNEEVKSLTAQTISHLQAVALTADLGEIERRLVTVRTNLVAWEPYL